MDKKPKRSYDVVILGILTLFSALTWIGFELYRNNVKPPESAWPVTSYHTTPLTPTLDTTVLDKLGKRLVVSQTQVSVPASESTRAATRSGSL